MVFILVIHQRLLAASTSVWKDWMEWMLLVTAGDGLLVPFARLQQLPLPRSDGTRTLATLAYASVFGLGALTHQMRLTGVAQHAITTIHSLRKQSAFV